MDLLLNMYKRSANKYLYNIKHKYSHLYIYTHTVKNTHYFCYWHFTTPWHKTVPKALVTLSLTFDLAMAQKKFSITYDTLNTNINQKIPVPAGAGKLLSFSWSVTIISTSATPRTMERHQVSNLGNQYNNDPHQDQIFDNPLLSKFSLREAKICLVQERLMYIKGSV